jgi:omega-6 fatty acid desaturase (delta-12 desaturase)
MNDNNVIFKQTINETELFMKYKPSYVSAFIDLSVHVFIMWGSFYLNWYFRNDWLVICTIPLSALMYGRTIIVFHHCGHNNYTPNKTLNYIIGISSGILLLNPFSWNFNHNTHHLTNGNIENKYDYPYNETIFNTLRQYKDFSRIKQSIYKAIRTPVVFFTIVPMIKFLIVMRFNAVRLLNKKMSIRDRNNFIIIEQLFHNIGVCLMIYYLHTIRILYVSVCIFSLGYTMIVMTFHCQHAFNPPYVVNNEKWNVKASGINGSSFIKFPIYIKYFWGGEAYHHVHHMNSKIPFYNLQKYHEEVVSKSNMFDCVVQLSLTDCYNNLWLVLYDEEKKRYITFSEADKISV